MFVYRAVLPRIGSYWLEIASTSFLKGQVSVWFQWRIGYNSSCILGKIMSDKKNEEVAEGIDDEVQLPLMIDEASSVDADIEAKRRRNTAVDEDDETWTNQPASAGSDLVEEGLDDEEEDENEAVPAPRKAIENARDVVCDELPDRAARAAMRLKPFLTGTFVFEFINTGGKFLFDWRGDTPVTKPLSKETVVTCDEAQGFVSTEKGVNVDTVIFISEAHLMAVRSGSLNPQVGMLTDKIRVKGRVGPAVYIFNVVAPRVRH